MKCIIFSDLHAAQHKKQQVRLEHCLDVLQWVFDVAKKNKIKNILFGGDLFQDRKFIDIYTYQRVFEVFQKNMNVDDRPNCYLLLGNHDIFYLEKKDISSVYPLSSIDGITVINKPCCLKVDDQEVAFLPYTHDPLADLDDIKIKSKFKILIGHVALDGAILNKLYGSISDVQIEGDTGMTVVGPDIFDGYDRVFLGHYHAAQKINNNIEYIGSPLQLNFGEISQEKHIIYYDSEKDEKEYIANTFSPIHFRFSSAKEAMNAAIVGGLQEQFVEVLDDNIASTEVFELKKLVSSQKPGSFNVLPKPKKIEQQKQDAQKVLQAVALLADVEKMLVNYIDSISSLSLDKEELRAVGKKICDSVLSEDNTH